MSEPIKAGDLVVCNRPTPCCANDSRVGYTFIVGSVSVFGSYCHYCGTLTAETAQALIAGVWGCIQTYRLKRIPPLSELEGERTQEDIREPA